MLQKSAVSGNHTLLDLHKLIQDAFEFDDDHLYAFYMDGKRFSRNCYNSPMDDVGPFVTEAAISKLGLYEKQKFLYLFDFGAEWKFTVTLLKVTDEENAPAAIVERKGDSPSQYSW
ncbi:IS1096 element passenger TnpR family protein [Mesobacillus boroniphilus]|uniref:Gll2959 protein n=1 Tax=Mesobacillus boroniphilus JCM 21738 TaxID=1294265 RepID=W4RUI6_9BACI|nr:hypothetical protein [Mesobacillus boroniphilus]GAE47319.1 gll2959 protein [Mesobacillus boroniphilus JCM 21738]